MRVRRTFPLYQRLRLLRFASSPPDDALHFSQPLALRRFSRPLPFFPRMHPTHRVSRALHRHRPLDRVRLPSPRLAVQHVSPIHLCPLLSAPFLSSFAQRRLRRIHGFHLEQILRREIDVPVSTLEHGADYVRIELFECALERALFGAIERTRARSRRGRHRGARDVHCVTAGRRAGRRARRGVTQCARVRSIDSSRLKFEIKLGRTRRRDAVDRTRTRN